MKRQKKYSEHKRKFYVISASDYETKEQALADLDDWNYLGDLKEGTKVYEITETTKVLEPKLELKEI